jgi:hypothetical protein
MELITGKYLENPENPDLAILEPENNPLIIDWPPDLSETGTLEEMEQLFLMMLRMMDGKGLPLAIPSFELEGKYYPLTMKAYDDLSYESQEKLWFFPTTLLMWRLARDEDE